MIVLGLNAFHADSSACIVRDGNLVAAVEEERFRRVKHWAGFPFESVRYCLREAHVTLADVDHIAVNQNNWANIAGKLRYVLARGPSLNLLRSRLRNRQARGGLAELIAQAFPAHEFRGRFHRIEHHFAHLSSAFHVSPFRDAAVLSVDGFGDFASAAWGVGSGTEIRIDGRVQFPHSLGIFYQAMTQYLGFPHYGDEYKVMGLAPYGQPSRMDAMREIVRLEADGRYALNLDYFRHHRAPVAYQWTDGGPQFDDLFAPALESLLGPRRAPNEPLTLRHRDVARSVQGMYEEALLHLLTTIQAKTGLTDLALAGGCAMNSVANGKARRETPFRRIYVQAAAGDAGGAIGAAFAAWHRLGGERSFVMDSACWGPGVTGSEIDAAVAAARPPLDAAGCRIHTIDDEAVLCRRVAEQIASGKVVGWFHGRMEWGPRALGNRSILGDPRRADMKALLNEKIKRRESCRPFAPSILEEAVADWFEEDAAVPFMTEVLQVRPEKRALIPAVTHVDGSGRLQTVASRANPRYHRLIGAFAELTGVPMLLNTSFNENEPIVCAPQQALDCFLRTQMDLLVLENVLIERGEA